MYTYSVDISIHYKKYIHKGYSEAGRVSGRSNSFHGWKLASGGKHARKNKIKGGNYHLH